MKKWFGSLLGVGLLTFSAGATTQYDTIRQNAGAGIIVTDPSAIYLKLSGNALPQGVTSFGYYLVDQNLNRIAGSGQVIDLSGASDSRVFVGNFDASERIAFWMQTDQSRTDQEYFDSIYRGNSGNDRNAAYVRNNGQGNTEIVIGYGGYGGGYSPAKPGKLDSVDDFVFTVEGQPLRPGPNGEPLPGILLCLLPGAAWLATRRIKSGRYAANRK